MRWPFKLLFRRPTAEQPAAVKVVPARREWRKLAPLTPTLDTRPPTIGVISPAGPITSDTRPLTERTPRPVSPPESEGPAPAQPVEVSEAGLSPSPTPEVGSSGVLSSLPEPTAEVLPPESQLPMRPLRWAPPVRPTPPRPTGALVRATDEFVGEPLEPPPPPPPEPVDPWMAELMRTYLPQAGLEVPEKYRLSEEEMAAAQQPRPSRSEILRQRPTLGQARRLGLGPPISPQQLQPPSQPPETPEASDTSETPETPEAPEAPQASDAPQAFPFSTPATGSAITQTSSPAAFTTLPPMSELGTPAAEPEAPEVTSGPEEGTEPEVVVVDGDTDTHGEGWMSVEDSSDGGSSPSFGPTTASAGGPVYVSRPGSRRGPDAELIPPPIAQAFQRRTGHDVSRVTVRRDPSVLGQTEQLKTVAFTRDEQIHLPREAGELHEPHLEGVLHHELTHVVQQREYGPGLPDEDSPEGMFLEAQAQIAENEALGRPAPTYLLAPLRHRAPVVSVDPADLLGPLLAELRMHGVLAEREPTRPVPTLAASGVQRKMPQDEFQRQWIERLSKLLADDEAARQAYPDKDADTVARFFADQAVTNQAFRKLMEEHYALMDKNRQVLQNEDMFRSAWLQVTEKVIINDPDHARGTIFPGLQDDTGSLRSASVTALNPIIANQYQLFREAAGLPTSSGGFGSNWVTIPSVYGMSYGRAAERLKSSGLTIGEPMLVDHVLEAGSVVGTQATTGSEEIPWDAAGKEVHKGKTVVRLVVSIGTTEATLAREMRKIGGPRSLLMSLFGKDGGEELPAPTVIGFTDEGADWSTLPAGLQQEFARLRREKEIKEQLAQASFGAGAAAVVNLKSSDSAEDEDEDEDDEDDETPDSTPTLRVTRPVGPPTSHAIGSRTTPTPSGGALGGAIAGGSSASASLGRSGPKLPAGSITSSQGRPAFTGWSSSSLGKSSLGGKSSSLVDVPSVRGMSADKAMEVLERAVGHGNVAVAKEASWLPDGQALYTDPPAGTEISLGSPVVLVISETTAEERQKLYEKERAALRPSWLSLFGMSGPDFKEEEARREANIIEAREALLARGPWEPLPEEEPESLTEEGVPTNVPGVPALADPTRGNASSGRPELDPRDLPLNELVNLIYHKVRSKVRHELLVDRERSGRLTDYR